MPPLATVEDLRVRYVDLTEAHEAVLPAWLDDVSDMVRVEQADIDGLVARSELAARTARRIVCAAIIRVLKHPDGLRSETVDTITQTWDAAVSSGELYLTADERRQLQSLTAVTATGAAGEPAGGGGDVFVVSLTGR